MTMPLPPRELAFAARLHVELHAVDVEAVARLGDLGRAVEGLAVEAGEDRAVAVAAARGAPAADLRLDDREVAAGVGMRAADERAADRGEVAGRQALRQMRREAAPDQVVDADARPRSRSRAPRAPWRRRPSPPASAAVSGRNEPSFAGDVRVGERLEDHLRGDHRRRRGWRCSGRRPGRDCRAGRRRTRCR